MDGFSRVHPGVLRDRSGSLSSVGYALGVVGFVRGRWVQCVAPCAFWGSFGVPRFSGVHPVGRRVSLGSLASALVVVGFVRARWVQWVAPFGSSRPFGFVGFSGLRPGGSSGSFGVAGFSGVRPKGSYSSFWVAAFSGVRPGCRSVRSQMLGSLRCALGVFGFVPGRWGAPFWSSGSCGVTGFRGVRPKGSSGSFAFAAFSGVRPGCRPVRSGMLGSLGCP